MSVPKEIFNAQVYLLMIIEVHLEVHKSFSYQGLSGCVPKIFDIEKYIYFNSPTNSEQLYRILSIQSVISALVPGGYRTPH